MRRLLITAALAALATAAIIGPFTTMAAAPYVYGCGPAANPTNSGSTSETNVGLYNANTVLANVTAKLLAANGANLNAAHGITTTFTIAPGNTRWITWTNSAGDPRTSNSIGSTFRVVSDQPLAPYINSRFGVDNMLPCIYLHP